MTPRPTRVIDASAVSAVLVAGSADSEWVTAQLGTPRLVAPHLLPVEVTNTFRRAVLGGRISAEVAALAHADLLDLRISLFPYEPFAPRVWELRDTLTAYDAWYVALAESFGCAFVTLDRRLAHAPGPTCVFITPP